MQGQLDAKNAEVDTNVEIGYNKATNNLWEVLSKKEQALLYKHIDELHHQKYYKNKLPNGKYLFVVENKIVVSDGSFQRPSIDGVIEFYAENTMSLVEDYFNEYINDGHSIKEGVEYINFLFEEEVATYHGIDSSAKNSRLKEQGRDDSTNRGASQNGHNGRGVSGEAEGSIKASLKGDESASKPSTKILTENPTEKVPLSEKGKNIWTNFQVHSRMLKWALSRRESGSA